MTALASYPPGFAILDVQTTGLSPRSDRVVEIAIVRTDAWLRPFTELSTLINPERAMDATHVHGITSADAAEAPRFRDVAGLVTPLLRGAVLVCHCYRFDRAFLLRELERAGHRGIEPVGLCTLDLADRYLPHVMGRSLAACCEAVAVRIEHPHHAVSHARATAQLFGALARRSPSNGGVFASDLHAAQSICWPDVQAARALVPRELATYQRERRSSHVASLVHRLPAGASSNPDAEAYLCKLDEVLEDRMVTEAEGAALHELAVELGIRSVDLNRIHFDYLRDLARFAWADGVVTDAERADLLVVAKLLGFPPTAVQAALDAARNATEGRGLLERRPIEKGMRVCFSENDLDKEELEAAAVMAGLLTRTNVSKKTDLVVTADPQSKSAKLEKARALGTRILLEPLFVSIVNEMTGVGAKLGAQPPVNQQSSPASTAAPPPAPTSWPPGWYADPSGHPWFRYWNGAQWTQHLTPATT